MKAPRKRNRRQASEDFFPGDIVIIIRALPHADPHTPRPHEYGYINAVLMGRKKDHNIHVLSLDNPGKDDWFTEREIEPVPPHWEPELRPLIKKHFENW